MLNECNKVQIRFKHSPLSKKTDARRGSLTALYDSITLPERFELDAFEFEVTEDVDEGHMMPPQEIMLADTSKNMETWTFSLDEYCEGDAFHLETCAPAETPTIHVPSPQLMDIDVAHTLPDRSNSGISLENLRDYTSFPVNSLELEMLNETEERSRSPARPIGEEHNLDAEKSQLLEMHSVENGEGDITTEGLKLSVTIDADSVSNPPDVSGATTPDFMAVQTPAIKERGRSSRKRKKCLFDSDLVLPNKVLRKRIHDASGLVRPRMRAPHTTLNTWRAHLIPNLSLCFLEPLIPCNSLELRSLYCNDNEPKTLGSAGKKQPPEKIGLSNSLAGDGSSLQRAVAPGTPVQHSASEATDKGADKIDTEKRELPGLSPVDISPEQAAFAPQTPAQQSTLIGLFEGAKVAKSVGARPSSLFESPEKESCLRENLKTSDLRTISISEEISSSEEGTQEQNGWSARTRTVARFLKKIFSERMEHQEAEVVKVLQVLQGQPRKESARLFYEILVLKTKCIIDVHQESAYDDILVQKSYGWGQSCEELADGL